MADKIKFTCESCDVTIRGETWDIQESPRLYCPSCDGELALELVE